MKEKKTLHSTIYNSFLRASLIPIFAIEVTLLVLYFGINYYISQQNFRTLLDEAKSNISEISKKEAKIINNQLLEVSKSATFLQKEHELFFKNKSSFGMPNGNPSFGVASNGVFYKTNKIGSSIYYSSKTKIGQKELLKATKTEFMDVSFKSLIETNSNIVAVYFNSYDAMNRLYPFIDDVAKQFGGHINMEDFNFYYLADAKHNPKKIPVWTEAYLDPAGNGWMTSCVVPIYNGQFLEGVTGIDITIETFVKNILNLDLPWNSKAFLIDSEGTILAMPKDIQKIIGLNNVKKVSYDGKALTSNVVQAEEFNIFKNKDVSQVVKNMVINNQKMAILENSDKKYMMIQEEIESTKWRLVILADEAIILNPINELKSLSNKIGYFAVALMIVFYILFFIFLLRKSKILANEISRPIISLTEYIKNIGISKTNFNNKFDAGIAEVDFIATFSTQIQRVNNEFFETNKKLEELNSHLKQKVKDEVDKNRQKEGLLIQQSKMAAMGEMIGSIVHQWKQPLNAINIAISSLQFRNEIQMTSPDDIDETTKIINSQIEHMSQTMNDFKNFFKPTSLQEYSLVGCFEDSLKLVNSLYASKQININFQKSDRELICKGYPNETIQIIINILNNARDVIIEKDIKKRDIDVEIKEFENFAILSIKDYAGGIPSNIIEKIFEPYFSTKGDNGTGIGLYMSKTIVEKVGGEIVLENYVQDSYQGAIFTIKLPIAQQKG